MKTTNKRKSSPEFDDILVKVVKRIEEEKINFRQAFRQIAGREPGGQDYREARKVGYENENFRKMGKRTLIR